MHRLAIAILLLFSLNACWPTSVSFSDAGSLPPCLKHFQMDPLEISAANAPINYPIELTEAVKAGIQNNTRLLLGSPKNTPQVTITGKINSYSVMPIALQQGDNAAMNRLTVSATFNIFFDCPAENYNLEMNTVSTRFADFPSSQDVTSVETQLLQEINQQIVQDVINKVLSNW